MALCTIVLTVILLFAMTTAWYTNVAQTSGLVFEVEQWGFSGSIWVDEQTIQAAPGTSGVVTMSIENTSDQTASVVVTAAKTNMTVDMCKRVFFYVDTPQMRNGEQMQRVYLTSTSGYTYTLRSQEKLEFSSTSYNDAPVCWEWVYDMLGYYVQGKPNEAKTDITVDQYIRPIVYDYDSATFTEEAGGRVLKTVDGTTTVEQFLTELSKTDGYEGVIDTSAAKRCGDYYPVAVDENGSGVWAYLCNFAEIEQGIQYDTAFAQAAATNPDSGRFSAKLSFTAQNLPASVATVSSAETLQSALTNADVDIIKLEQNVELQDTLSLPAGCSAVLDLNGNSLSGTGRLITVNSNANLSIANGTIAGTGASGQEAIRSIGAAVSLSDVVVQNVDYGVVVVDNLGEADSRIKIKDCVLTTSNVTVLLQGNGPASEAKTQLIVENTKITSDYTGISGQGSASGTKQYWGTDIQVINSVVKGQWAGIYHPQQKSTLTVSGGSEISGYTGIAVKGGEVTIADSTVLGTGASQEPAATSSGWTDTGDGVYVEASYPWSASVVIEGATVSSISRKSVELFSTASGGPGSIKIYGGTFTPAAEEEYWVTENP